MRSRQPIIPLFVVSIIFCASFAPAQTKGTFQAGINYPAGPATVPSNTGYLFGGISPIETHIGDFNGDGKPDIVLAASCSQPSSPAGSGYAGIPGCPASNYAVVVYLSNGDGTFGPPIISGGMAPALRSIAVGDFNGDGKLDIAAASDCLSTSDCSSGSVTILLGNGDGTFSAGAYYPLGGIVSQANTITVGDLNGDGKPDIVVGIACYNIPVNGCSVGSVEVFVGDGDGTFQSPNTYTTTGNSAILPVVGDFNKDGKADVLATPGYTLLFFPGNGDGTLGTPSSTAVAPSGTEAIVAGDFNGDGNLDVAVGAYVSAVVAFGNGDGTFQTPVSYALNCYVSSIVAADMNGDGKPDLIAGVSQGGGGGFGAAVLLLNDGTGNFTNISTFPLGGWEFEFIGVADFNGDGKNDIVLASGLAEVSQGGSDGTISILLGNGDGTMRSAQYVNENPNGTDPTVAGAAAAADFNGDGFQDLIFPSGCGPGDSCTPSGFTLLLSNGAGGFQAPLSFTAPVNGANFLAVADFNGDGKPDVAVFNNCDASCTGTSVSIFLNTGNGTFSDPNVYEGGGVTQRAIVAGDFNGDGKADIAVLNACDQSCSVPGVIGILLGNGDGSFQPVVTTNMPSGPATWIAGGNFNSDGTTDLVVVEGNGNVNDPYAGSAQILLSNGDGTFTFGNSYATGGDRSGNGMAVTTGDLNGDGKADIVIGNFCEPIVRGQLAYDVNCANGSIGVLLGNGDGTFQYGPSYDIPDANFLSIALADVNGDGKLDYIASTETGVAVSFGNGDGSFQPPTVYAALYVYQNVQLAIADLNGDGGLDIVQPGASGQLALLYNQGFSNPQPVVTLQSSMDPSTYGQQVTFTSTVTSASGTPTGTVTFLDGATKLAIPVTLANGSASLTFAALAAGIHSIVADYSGDNNFVPANSAALTQTVNEASTTIQMVSSANPSYVDQGVTFRATVTGQFQGLATGSVTFKQGKVILATETLTNGQATYATTFTTTGARSITATYSGDGNNLPSTSAALKQVVDSLPAATTTSVATSGSPLFVGQSVTFTAKVFSTYGPIPDGEPVTFSDGATTLATVALSGGLAAYSTSSLKAATHTIKVVYAGDGTFKASTGSVREVINLYPSSTSAPGSSLNPSTYGQEVTLTVTVSSTAPDIPTGTVTFKNGAATLGTGTLDSSGVATLTKTNLPVGSLSISAVYNGDSETTKSSSAVMIQTVNQATSATAVTSSRNPSTVGQLVKFTATVTSSTTTPTGTVTFMDGSNVLTTANLAGGKASYSTSALEVGSHSITAVYNGTTNITGSTSTVLVQIVN
jgi:hypothetical protein